MAEYLDELDDDCGTESEFDRVAIRCDFAEYKSLVAWAEEYFGWWPKWASEIGLDPDATPEEVNEQVRDYINDRGILIEFDGGIIVSSF